MQIHVTAIPADQFFTDPLGIPVFTDVRPPHREAGRVDLRLSGMISNWTLDGTVDPASATPTLFTSTRTAFPMLVISGAGVFDEMSAPAVERTIAGIVETFLRAQAPLFAIAARDFKKDLTPARDSAEIILRGIAHGCNIADIHSGHIVRVHWVPDEVELLVSELRRFRYHIPQCRDWQIETAPEDEQWMAGHQEREARSEHRGK